MNETAGDPADQRPAESDGALRAERDALRRRVDEYEQSTSWRVTAPLRSTAEALRALRGRVQTRLPGSGSGSGRGGPTDNLAYWAGPGPRFVPPGHFYSPIPDLAEVRADADRIFTSAQASLPGVDFNDAAQMALLAQLVPFYAELPFTAEKQDHLRYFFDNPNFGEGDAILLYGLLRHLRPRRIIEIGSGYSSAVTLDTNEHFLDWSAKCTFIEPYPELLYDLLRAEDRERVTIIDRRIQDVPLAAFAELEAGDVLFIDSTHVSKIGSDVNREIFEIVPTLASGVYVHFHDIFASFEYPREWVEQGRAWTEDYLLHAFLMFNREFEIVAFNSYLAAFHRPWLEEHMPLMLRNTGSLWLKRR